MHRKTLHWPSSSLGLGGLNTSSPLNTRPSCLAACCAPLLFRAQGWFPPLLLQGSTSSVLPAAVMYHVWRVFLADRSKYFVACSPCVSCSNIWVFSDTAMLRFILGRRSRVMPLIAYLCVMLMCLKLSVLRSMILLFAINLDLWLMLAQT
jgi:hypothetical protein